MNYLLKIPLFITIILGLIYQPLIVKAQEDLPFLVAPQVDLFFNQNKTGPLDRLFKEFEKQGLISGYTVLPTLRARRHFLSDKNSCYTPTEKTILEVIGLPPENFVISQPFNLVKGILVFKNNHPALTDNDILEKTTIGTVGLVSSYGMGGFKFKKINTPDPDKMIELYERGRFEGVYLFLPNANNYPKASQLLKETKPFQKLLWQGENAITCHINQKNSLEKLNKTIQELKENGKLKEILGIMYNFD